MAEGTCMPPLVQFEHTQPSFLPPSVTSPHWPASVPNPALDTPGKGSQPGLQQQSSKAGATLLVTD
jgi:hypothetical protein